MGFYTYLKKIKRKEKTLRVLILGLDGAGKSSVVLALQGQEAEPAPTVGFVISTLDVPPYRLNLWDIGGQKSIRAYWRNYFEETDAMIWVVDSLDDRLELCRDQLHEVLKEEVR